MILTFLAGILAFISGTYAQQADSNLNRSLLWRVSGNHLHKPSYLFGTIHQVCPNDYFWTPAMQKGLKKSKKVCFEMDLDDPKIMMEIAAGMMDPSGKQLKDYFTPAQYKKLGQYVQDILHMDISTFATVRPIMLASIIEVKKMKCANPVSYEENIMKAAQDAGKEILGLEDPKDQLAALKSIPVDTVIKGIIDIIEGNEQENDELKKLVAAYVKQDLPALHTMITSSTDLEGGMGMLLDDRNKKWIPRIKDGMSKSSVFFAVGAGHLSGDNGIITLLRKEGYTVTPVH